MPPEQAMATAVEAACRPTIAPELIEASATGFKRRSAAAAGWHPRHFAALSQPGLLALGEAWRAAEVAGGYPPTFRQLRLPVLQQLEESSTPGEQRAKARIIGVFPRAWRVHLKAR